MKLSSKRAEYTAIMGFVLSLFFFGGTLILSGFSRSLAVAALGFHALGAALVWLVLVVVYHQRSLAEQEQLDMSLLSQSDTADTIFQGSADRKAMFTVASKRLVALEKWFVPIGSVVVGLYQAGIGLFLMRSVGNPLREYEHMQITAVLLVVIAFISFLISRYATGMSTEEKWRDLRAGGSMLLACSILAFLLGISFAFGIWKITAAIFVFRYVIPILMVVLGGETILNAIFDIYRPRIAGAYSRAAFDSRLLGVINEPGGLVHTFANMIDYQFGFQVSQTWFYKLLAKAIVPLALFLILCLYSLSCILIIPPSQAAVIEHFGSFENGGRIASPGINWKLPWPMEKAYIYEPGRIHQVDIGFVDDGDNSDTSRPGKPLLWGKKHYDEEYNILVATTDVVQELSQGAVPVSIIRAAVPVQYRIKDLKDFVYNHTEPEDILKAISYREVSLLAAGSTIETEGERADSSLLGAGRAGAAKELIRRIQTSADEQKLGIEIVFVGLQGVHPPEDVAEEYQAVIGAVQTQQGMILNAMAERNEILSSLGGSVEVANELYDIAVEYRKAKESGDKSAAERIAKELETKFSEANGEIFKSLRQSQSYAFNRAVIAEATGKRFASQIKANEAAPNIYKRLLRLAMLEEALKDTRKYVIVADEQDSEVIILDLQEKLTPNLLDMDLDELSGQ
jgi:regulator of protease activity HflC (stomatin/prohibitin superfamily)